MTVVSVCLFSFSLLRVCFILLVLPFIFLLSYMIQLYIMHSSYTLYVYVCGVY